MSLTNLDWNDIMDWVVVVSCAVVVLGFILDIFKSFKDVKGLSKEHTNIKDCSEKQHRDLKECINDKHNQLQKASDVTFESISEIDNKVSNIDKMIFSEIQKSDMKYDSLTDRQKDLKEQVKAIETLMKELERLQRQSFEQKLTIEKLTEKVTELQNQLARCQRPIYPNQISGMDNNFTQQM